MPKDILLDENLDLVFKNGDFSIGESTAQHQKLLILSDKGELKANPKQGVGARKYLETHKPDDFAREIRQEFSIDGMSVDAISIGKNLEMNITAQYNEN